MKGTKTVKAIIYGLYKMMDTELAELSNLTTTFEAYVQAETN